MKKYLLLAIFVSILAWHVTATILYTLPANPLTPKYISWVHAYMNPFFAQNWNLFAPEPATSSLQFWYRCQSGDGAWSAWKDPVIGLIKKHRENRFTPRGKLIYVYQSIARQCLNRYLNSAEKEKFVKDPSYVLAKRFTSDLCRQERSATHAQFQIVKVFTKDFSKRESDAFGKVETVPFLPFAIEGAEI